MEISANKREIIHIDMDMFFAAVEIRDDPSLADQPVIIGALPNQRGVVSTCSYAARKYGVASAMNIKEAYRRCPNGIYLKPNFAKYEAVSQQLHQIWDDYTDCSEYISLDEGFLDVTATAKLFGGAEKMAREIKKRVKEQTGLSCSVGVGYCPLAAKLASEEKKPDGFFVLADPVALRRLIIDRPVTVIYGVGAATAGILQKLKIKTVRALYNNRQSVITALGNQGRHILALADGQDDRIIGATARSTSLGKELTFQQDTADRDYLRDVLRLFARQLSYQLRCNNDKIQTVTLKLTFPNMQKITRSQKIAATNKAEIIYETVAKLFAKVEERPIRLIGLALSGFTKTDTRQLSLFDPPDKYSDKLAAATMALQQKYGLDIVKSGRELLAEKRLKAAKDKTEQ